MALESGMGNQLMTIRASGTWQFGFSSEIKLEHLEASEEQPTLSETTSLDIDGAMGAVIGCTCGLVSEVAREMDFRHNGVDLSGEASFTVETPSKTGQPMRRFDGIRYTVTLRTDEEDGRFEQLATEVERRCRFFDTLERAGISHKVDWKKSSPSV